MGISITGGLAVITAPTDGFISPSVGDLIDAIAVALGVDQPRGTAQGGTTSQMQDKWLYQQDGFFDDWFLKCLGPATAGNLDKQFRVDDFNTGYANFVPTADAVWASGNQYRITPFDQLRCLSSGMVKGLIDQAIEASHKFLYYEVTNTGLAVSSGNQEYNYLTISSAPSYIKKLKRVQYQPSASSEWVDLRFELVGDGESFHLIDTPNTSSTLRLIAECYALRTDSAGTTVSSLTTESDQVFLKQGMEQIIIYTVARDILSRENIGAGLAAVMPISLQVIESKLQEVKSEMGMKPVSRQMELSY